MGIFQCSVDYYRILKVEQTSDVATLKRVYHDLALKYHPDKHDGCLRLQEKFKMISAAYDVVGDPQTRGQYDTLRHKHVRKKRCKCKMWTEQPDIWAIEDWRSAKVLPCHCENCDPEVKKSKERERDEAEKRETERKEEKRRMVEKERVREEERLREEGRLREEERLREQEKERKGEERRQRIERAKAERKCKVREEIEEEYQTRQQEIQKKMEHNRLKLERKTKEKESERLRAENLRQTAQATQAAPTETYEKYWTSLLTMTPYYQSIRNDFDEAMRVYYQALLVPGVDDLEQWAGTMETKQLDMEQKARKWAEASSIANRLLKKKQQED